MSLISVDFPDPDTPVTQTNTPRGIVRVTSFRLFASAPVSVIIGVFLSIIFLGNSNILLFPDKYGPVTESGSFKICPGVPWKITRPPNSPESGPISIT